MKRMSVTVKGDRWNIFYLPTKEYQRRFGNDSLAITQYRHSRKNPERNVYFSPRDRSIGTIIHELLHVYASYVVIDRPTPGKVEEEMCEIVGRRFVAILATALRIKSFLNFR